MLVHATFIESAVCHHVKIRVLADQSNNFIEMERCVRYKHSVEDLLSVNKSTIRKTNEKHMPFYVCVFVFVCARALIFI